MSKPHRNRSRQIIVALAGTCVLAGLISWWWQGELRQSGLNEGLYSAVEFGSTAEMAALLEQGANPNYVPMNQGRENLLSALITSMRYGRLDLHVSQGLPVLAYTINGFSYESPQFKQLTVHLKSIHMLTPPVRYSDPLGKMRVLLDHHADPNRNYSDSNPLLHALGLNRADAMQLLLQYGADPDAVSANGIQARKVASRNSDPAIRALMAAKTVRRSR